jgi:hypothetical protein
MKEEKKKKKIKTDVILKGTSSNYVKLIGDADRKARIMLVVNSVFLTLSITLMTKLVGSIQYGWIFASILMASNVVSLFFSVQSVKPEFNLGKEEQAEDNILHYKKCAELSLDEYRAQINSTIIDEAQKMESFIKELYFYGRLLNSKYRLLKMAYYFFSLGILLAVLTYIILLITVNRQEELSYINSVILIKSLPFS